MRLKPKALCGTSCHGGEAQRPRQSPGPLPSMVDGTRARRGCQPHPSSGGGCTRDHRGGASLTPPLVVAALRTTEGVPAPPLPCCKSGVWGLAGSGSWGAAQPNSTALRAPVPRAHSCHHSQPHAGDLDSPRPMFRTLAPSPAAGDALYQRVSSSLHGLLFPAVCSCRGLLAPGGLVTMLPDLHP